MEKTCTKCGITKSTLEFCSAAHHKDGLTSACRKCERLRLRKWKRTHKELTKQRSHKYYIENREACIQRGLRWDHNNPEKRAIKQAKCRKHRRQDPIWREKQRKMHESWRRRNPEKWSAICRNYKIAKRTRIPKWADLKTINEFYENCPEGYEVDHIIPLRGETVSGLHVLNNLQYLTRNANRSKGNRFSNPLHVQLCS